jgi:hypothetical protein
MTLLTCVSSYFLVKNKHGNKYNEWFNNSLSINCPYVFFTNKSNIEFIKSFRKELPTYFIECEIEDFYTYKYRDNMITHQYHCPSIELNLIWNEKIFMVQKASQINPFGSEWFKWVDAGICTYRDTKPPNKEFPNPEILKQLPKDKFIYCSSDPYIESAVTRTNYYHHVSSGSYVLHKNFINKFTDIYNYYLNNLLDINNIWTEQVILTHIYKDCPDLYFKLSDGYGSICEILYS